MSRRQLALWLGGITLAGAALRFGSLDAKGFWQDEAATVLLLRMDLGSMISALPDLERTPPLYYAIAWVWTRVFGEGEIGLRSLSALAGTATIPVAFLAARELTTRRVALFASGLVAVSPILVWYSQEGRAYALAVLLAAASIYLFARSLRDPRGRDLAGWALVSALAIGTHYFAGFLVAAEVALLLWRLGPRRELLLAAAVPLAVALALAPLAIEQAEGKAEGDFITDTALSARLVQAPAFLLAGFELRLPVAALAGLAAGALALAGLALVATRADGRERRGAAVAVVLALAGLGLPLLLSLGGVDYLIYKNVLWVAIPTVIAVSAGFGAAQAGWLGPAAGTALAAISLASVLATASEPKYQRESWREAAEALGEADGPRAIVATPGIPAVEPLTLYREGSEVMDAPATVTEIALLALPRRDAGALANAELPAVEKPPPAPAPGFHLSETVRDGGFLLFRYTAARSRRVAPATLEKAAPDGGASAAVVVEP